MTAGAGGKHGVLSQREWAACGPHTHGKDRTSYGRNPEGSPRNLLFLVDGNFTCLDTNHVTPSS